MKEKNLLSEIYFKVRLMISLLLDKRVAIYLKIIPVAALIYVVVPDIIIGPIDDAALMTGAVQLFISLCPAEIVEEHTRKINRSTRTASEDTIDVIEKKD